VAPVEQAGVELFFQLLDLEGHRGLGHEQRFAARVKSRGVQPRGKPEGDDRPWIINVTYGWPYWSTTLIQSPEAAWPSWYKARSVKFTELPFARDAFRFLHDHGRAVLLRSPTMPC
jgi:hypothetical protein